METQPVNAVRVVVYRPRRTEPEVLVLQRSEDDPHKPGRTELPGGEVEPRDETLELAGVRETREEAGLRLDPEALRPVCAFDRPGRTLGVVVTQYYFAVEASPEDDLEIGSEHSRGFWVPLSQACQLVPPHHRQVLEQADEAGLLDSDIA